MIDSDGITRELSEFISNLALDDVPGHVQDRTKYLILDALACGLVGAHLPWSETAVNSMTALDDGTTGAIWGWGRSTSGPTAALLNGTFVQSFELDDYYEHGPLHSGSVVVPSLLATLEADPSISGEQALLSAVVGYEIGPRLGVALDGYELLKKGWHCGAIYGVLAAASASAKARQLGADQVEDALGIAATQASGLMAAQFEAMVKRMHHGLAARNGMVAAGLAAGGYTGIKQVLEREYGGVRATFNPDTSDLQLAVQDLGDDWLLSGINVKPYAAMAGLHPAIDAARKFRAEDSIAAEDVAEVVIEMALVPFKHGGWLLPRPATVIGAQMNCAYSFSVALIDGQALIPQYTPDRIEQPDVWNLMERVRVRHSEEMDDLARQTGHKRVTQATLTTRSGSTIQHRIVVGSGQGEKLLANQAIVDKYRSLTSLVMDDIRISALEDAVMNLDIDNGVRRLIDLLREPVRSPFS